MAALPKKKPSNTYRGARRNKQYLKFIKKGKQWILNKKGNKKTKDPKKAISPSHQVNIFTGKYKGIQVIDFENREERRNRRIQRINNSNKNQ